jgi:excisionase family DNA binding protein
MNPTVPEINMLTLDQVAEEIGVAKSTVEEWVYNKDLASFKKGGVRRVNREDLVRFVALNTLKPRRPDWLTAKIESDFRQLLENIIAGQVAAQLKVAA